MPGSFFILTQRQKAVKNWICYPLFCLLHNNNAPTLRQLGHTWIWYKERSDPRPAPCDPGVKKWNGALLCTHHWGTKDHFEEDIKANQNNSRMPTMSRHQKKVEISWKIKLELGPGLAIDVSTLTTCHTLAKNSSVWGRTRLLAPCSILSRKLFSPWLRVNAARSSAS